MIHLLSSKTVTARKAHRCNCCGLVAVRPGETYLREGCVSDGRAYTWIACDPCSRLLPEVWEWAGNPDYGVGSDDYQEWADEYRDDPDLGERARAYLVRAGAV